MASRLRIYHKAFFIAHSSFIRHIFIIGALNIMCSHIKNVKKGSRLGDRGKEALKKL
jgi:hypothetical protein